MEPADRTSSLLTFGHGTATEESILDLLQGAGVRAVVDVRTAPGSRRNPHVARTELERWLPAAGIHYRWEPDLGGFRKAPADSPDIALEQPAFRGYAAHMRTPEFAAALDRVLDEAAERMTTVMCSETVWWRCHRRMIADFAVLVRETPVSHLLHDGHVAPHRLSDSVRVSRGLLMYDAGQRPLDAG